MKFYGTSRGSELIVVGEKKDARYKDMKYD